jgi:DNA topoisomerase-1
VIVESPTKVRTINKYLGKAYNVASTVGHIKDLPPREIGIDVEDAFKPKYRIISGKNKVVRALKAAAGDATEIFLAADPDREGEAIAWHTADILKQKGRKFYRVLFHELTKNGIQKAIQTPEDLNKNKYEAQQARRILDRLVGYQISPLLWRKVKGGLSAGRVQSVTVRIICERERAIWAFDSEEYWTITADLEGSSPPVFSAKLSKKQGKKIKIPDQAAADTILNELSGASYMVDKITQKTTKRNPLPPFITSKMQQEAIRKLRFSAKKTMSVAQQLYEGIDLGPGEPTGLITYMRTDSIRIAAEAAHEAMDLVGTQFGPEYSVGKPRFFKNRSKAQDAHEAIRPTSVYHTPEKLAPYLSKDQLLLYKMIWQRFMASQMQPALINQNTVAITAGDYTFTASGSSVKFPGFMALYLSADDEAEKKVKKQPLPELAENTQLTVCAINPKQHFTLPPPRFSEASLVKELEENGIGRPSTYASILSIIRDKGYVDFVKGYFKPSELGFIVNDLLVQTFPDIFSVDFTAKLETRLDGIEEARIKLIDVLTQFYEPFSEKLENAPENMLSVKGVGFETDLKCPACNGPLHIKVGKNGPFIACNNYPECRFSRDYTRTEKGEIQPVELPPEEATDKICDQCGQPMVMKRGRYGNFLACSGYPKCKNTQSLAGGNGEDLGIKCPEAGCDGSIVEKKSRRGKVFYGCNRFPKCTFATWDMPVDKPCPKCGAKFMVEKTTKKQGTFLTCINPECKHREDKAE